MKWLSSLCSVSFCLALAVNHVGAGEPIRLTSGWRPKTQDCVCPERIVVTPGQTPSGSEVQPAAPATDAFAQAPEAGGQPGGSFNPVMFGDIIGISGGRSISSSVLRTTPQGATPTATTIFIPVANAGAFKIADNESPRPLNRVFINYNYFNNVNGSINTGLSRFDLHRETIGFERAFLNGNVSFGMRLPFIQLTNNSIVEDNQVGDLTLIGKYAFINDPDTGNILSGGLVITTPTGEDFVTATGDTIHSTLLQPFLGYIFNLSDSLYLHGFSSLSVPTDSDDVTLLFNDIGLGYWLYRSQTDGLVSAVVPTAELHVNTPLNQRGSQASPVGFPDVVNITAGSYVVFRRGSTLGLALATPLTGPQPFDVEVLVNFNLRY